MALPTHGRVIVETTAGEIDIEIWSKETPQTCRNFITLAMEGYYDNVIFHRIVPGFLVQTGDRTGTGAGGESIYGEPFKNETHPRLRYEHRGLVAMANSGEPMSNTSQFFITLDRADELHGKNTLFGRVMGDTIYNVMKIGEMEIDKKTERPLYPPKIRAIRIVDNPFPDIVPRITAAERKAQQKARAEAQREREEEERRKGAKKNTKLLSFGADEETEEPVTFKKQSMFRPDLVEDSASRGTFQDFVAPSPAAPATKSKLDSESGELKPQKLLKKDKKELDITKIREKHAKEQASAQDSRRSEIERMEADILKITKRQAGNDSDEEKPRKKEKKSYLEEELAKYAKGRGLHKKDKKGRKKDESDVLAALNSFREKLQSSKLNDDMSDDVPVAEQKGESEGNVAQKGTGEEGGIEVDDDTGFLNHSLYFPKDNTEEVNKAERDYEVIDPRQRGARAREEERERKRLANKEKSGHERRYRK